MLSKANIKTFFFQLFTIAAGVYIGIVAGNWNDARKLRQAQSAFLQNIKKELQSNIKRLEWSVTQHEQLRVSLDSLSAEQNEGFLEQAFFQNNGFQMIQGWKGFGITTLTDNVFQTGLNTNVFSGLDFKTSSILSEIYNGLNSYGEFTDPIMDRALFDLNYDSKTKDVFFLLETLATDVLGSEKRLVKKLKVSIEKLEE